MHRGSEEVEQTVRKRSTWTIKKGHMYASRKAYAQMSQRINRKFAKLLNKFA